MQQNNYGRSQENLPMAAAGRENLPTAVAGRRVVIYSRFNCRHHCIETYLKDGRSGIRDIRPRMDEKRFEEKWLLERLDLFRTYTLPSVLSQTDQDFTWVGIAHPDSPKWFIEELQKVKRMTLKLAEWDVEAKEPPGHTSVNLDTDDAISRDFMACVSETNFMGETILIRGLKFRPKDNFWAYTRSYHTHFNVVRHPTTTVLDFFHGQGAGCGLEKLDVDTKRPMWLQVIHERNLLNKINLAHADKDMGIQIAHKSFDLDYNRIKEKVADLGYGRNHDNRRPSAPQSQAEPEAPPDRA